MKQKDWINYSLISALVLLFTFLWFEIFKENFEFPNGAAIRTFLAAQLFFWFMAIGPQTMISVQLREKVKDSIIDQNLSTYKTLITLSFWMWLCGSAYAILENLLSNHHEDIISSLVTLGAMIGSKRSLNWIKKVIKARSES